MSGRSARGWLFLVLVAIGSGCNGSPEGGTAGTANLSTPDKELKFVGFDASPPLIRALERGQLQGLVVQNPYRMGNLGVTTLVRHLRGEKVERKIATGEVMVTPENMNAPEIKKLLFPPKLGNGADSSVSGGKTKKWRVMVIPKGTTHEFWQTIHAGAMKAAEELQDVEIIWKGPQKEDDRSQQIELVQLALTLDVDGIVLAPLDARALVRSVEQAVARKVSVVIIDSALESDKPVSYVATDNYHGGVLGGERLAEVLKGEGKIILMPYALGSASTEEREKGFLDTIAKYPKISFVSKDQYAGATVDTAQRTAQNLVSTYRGEFDGVFCPNESSTSGMLKALEGAGMVKARR